MGKRKRPPHWQEGRREIEVVLPADKTKSGKQEIVRLAFNWKVSATKRMNARDWTRREMDQARDQLTIVRGALARGDKVSDVDGHNLGSALTHAVRAWCRTHLHCKNGATDTQHIIPHSPTRLPRTFFPLRPGLGRQFGTFA